MERGYAKEIAWIAVEPPFLIKYTVKSPPLVHLRYFRLPVHATTVWIRWNVRGYGRALFYEDAPFCGDSWARWTCLGVLHVASGLQRARYAFNTDGRNVALSTPRKTSPVHYYFPTCTRVESSKLRVTISPCYRHVGPKDSHVKKGKKRKGKGKKRKREKKLRVSA